MGLGSKKESSEDENVFIFNNTYTTITTTTPQPNPTLIEIGTFRGKSYFGDQVFRNWDDSKSFCEDHGLQLAKIDNKDQLQFLRNAVRTVVRQQWSWVSNTGGNEVKRNCINPLDRCPVLAPFGRSHMRRCRDRYFGLCQTVDSSE
ncbi:unnamed protein product [Orchesella dallaii]|uniref:C-type lectin domain-containing protein n=1 Tax=Orchesella dallaii TaxID=48710 RepID=A0ABP1PJC1_9HEXA